MLVLLRWILDAEDREMVREDLVEEYRTVIEPDLGKLKGTLWLAGMVVRSLGAWWTARIRIAFAGIRLDLTSSLVGLWRTRRLSVSAVGSIALGVAATSAVLTLYSAVIVRPLPFPDSDRLVRIWNDESSGDPRGAMAWADVRDIRSQLTRTDAFAATARSRQTILDEDGARRVQGEAVTPGYFRMVGAEPAIGRLFVDGDHEPAAPPVLALTFETWQTRFGGDPGIVGSTVRMATGMFTVVGVAERGFRGTIEPDLLDHEFWMPLQHDLTERELDQRGSGSIWTIARIAEGGTLEQLASEIATINAQLATLAPDIRATQTLRVEPLGESWRSQLRARNRLLVVAAILLLLVATCNVAGLLIGRTLTRTSELALRSALGAERGRLMRLIGMETTVLTIVGSAIGFVAAYFILRSFVRLAPTALPTYISVTPDARAVGLSVLVVGVTAIGVALMTAAVGTRVSPREVLSGQGRGNALSKRDRRAGEWIITGEVALTTLLIVAAGALGRTLHEMSDAELGYRTNDVLRLAVTINAQDLSDDDARPALLNRIRDELSSYPGVERVGLSWHALPPGYETNRRIYFDGMPAQFDDVGVPVGFHAVDPGYLPALGIEVRVGRHLTATDLERENVAIVSESVAEFMGGSEASIGRTLRYLDRNFEVVGVAADILQEGPVRRRPREADIYLPITAHPGRTLSIAVQTRTDPIDYLQPLQQRLGAIAPYSPQHWVSTMDAEIADRLGGPMFYTILLGTFALSALSLTAVGLFALVALQITRQRPEFSVRRALGASRSGILGSVVWRSVRPVGAGLFIGGLGCLAAARIVNASLYGIGEMDWTTLAVSLGAVSVLTMTTAALCALRVWQIAPAEVMRG